MIPGGPDIRSDTLHEAAAALRNQAVVVQIKDGDHAAQIVEDCATIVADLANEESPVHTNSHGLTPRERAVRDDERRRLIRHLELRTFQSVQRVLEDLYEDGWPA